MRNTRKRALARCAVGVAGAAVVAAALVPMTAYAAQPSLTVTPSTSLYNGETVAISASGLQSGEQIAFVECNTTGSGSDYCDTGHTVVKAADSSGAISTSFTVYSGKIGTNTAAVCSLATGNHCAVIMADVATQQPLGAQPIAFTQIAATPATGLKNGQVVSVAGAGLPANTSVVLIECNTTVAGAAGCNTGNIVSATTDATGNLPATHYTVKAGQVGTDPHSICAATTNGKCVIAVANPATQVGYGNAAIAFAYVTRVTAAASKTTVPRGVAFNIHGRTLASSKGVNGLTVVLFKRANSTKSWARVTSTKTKTVSGARGVYRFALHGLSHSEQYQVRHPRQKIAAKVYLAARSKTITIKP